MQFSAIFTTAFIAGLAAAAPAKRADAVSMAAADGAQWTLKGVTLTENSDNTQATWSYKISTGSGDDTDCSYTVSGNPANRASVNPTGCGNFQVSSNWSGQFGDGNGFTTIAVTDHKQIAYPAYTDAELKNATAVSPDRSYPAQAVPGQ